MKDRIRPVSAEQLRGRRRGDSQRRVPVGVVRREGLTGRRLGMQRRDRSAERKAWIGPIAALGLTGAAVVADLLAPALLDPVRDGAEVAMAPVQRAVIVPPTQELVAAEAERDRLADEVAALREEQHQDTATEELFQSDLVAGRELVPARVIGFSSSTTTSPDRRITLDVGSRDGIEADLTVVSHEGLVGRVISVTPWTSEVMVLGDPKLSVGVRSQDSAIGVLSATAPPGVPARKTGQLTLQAFQLGSFEKKDQLVTIGGSTSPFVAGIPVGRVVSVDPDKGQLQETAVVRPAVDGTSLDVVGVLTTKERDESRRTATIPEAKPPKSSDGSGGGDWSGKSSSASPTSGEKAADSADGPLDGNTQDDEEVLVSPTGDASVASDAPADAAEPTSGGSAPAPTQAPTDDLVPQPSATQEAD
ncbi:rod shape-determining protein MreC [Kytococcus aerolatus]|uniref:Cell shape-determining protein MreC n=1 Tax=Kytococcus aerolatus TaxID=592308 RepID=A0A212U0C1_9MICO|nr:rod shape-determining protein MreC [Kytococcus aerolatus]SNC71692.1 rod shape-determining protein MreC [Kytococcus aerolatus]